MQYQTKIVWWDGQTDAWRDTKSCELNRTIGTVRPSFQESGSSNTRIGGTQKADLRLRVVLEVHTNSLRAVE